MSDIINIDEVYGIPAVDGLEFEEKNHIYHLDGMEIPSVSEITKPLSNARYSGISSYTLDKAAEKGTAVHEAIELYIKYGAEDLQPEYMTYFDAFKDWYETVQPKVVDSEVRLCHQIMRYGGTADLVAYINGDLTLVDYKTTSSVSDMTCGVQLEAYAQALESMGVVIQNKMILHLKKSGRYAIREYPAYDAERWRVFGALKTVYNYIHS